MMNLFEITTFPVFAVTSNGKTEKIAYTQNNKEQKHLYKVRTK